MGNYEEEKNEGEMNEEENEEENEEKKYGEEEN